MTAVAFGILFAASIGQGTAEPRFHASTLSFPEGEDGRWFAPMDGDGREDLLLGVAKGGIREIWIYLQTSEGGFPAQPDRRVTLKGDIVAFATLDVRPEPGEELLFFTATSCFSYSTALEGFAGNARRIFAWDLICDVPDSEGLLKIEGVARSPSGPLIVLPGFPPGQSGGDECYGIFAPSTSGGAASDGAPWEIRGRLPLRGLRTEKRRSGRREIGIRIESDRENPLQDLVVPPGGSDEGGGMLLYVRRWLPAAVSADADGDGRDDVFLLDKQPAAPQLRVHLQAVDGKFSEAPSWTGRLPDEDDPDSLVVSDIDGDGRADLIARSSGLDGGKLFFFRNRGGRFEPSEPDQVMKFAGMGLEARAIDLDGDRRVELAVTSTEIPATSVATGGRVERRLFIHRSGGDRPFDPRPALRHEETFTASEIEGIGLGIVLDADLLGRGIRDALSVERDGTIAARHLTRDLGLESAPFWRFDPGRRIRGIEARDLNGDGRSDVILRHRRGLTLMVSR